MTVTNCAMEARADTPAAAEINPIISKAFRQQDEGISWWLVQYTLEDPDNEGELSTAGLDLLQALLPQQPSSQEAGQEAIVETADGRLTITTD